MVWATIVEEGFRVPVEKPMAPPRMGMAAPVRESNPMAFAIMTRMGVNAIKIVTDWVVAIKAQYIKLGSNTFL